jgi:hypothetical protein
MHHGRFKTIGLPGWADAFFTYIQHDWFHSIKKSCSATKLKHEIIDVTTRPSHGVKELKYKKSESK